MQKTLIVLAFALAITGCKKKATQAPDCDTAIGRSMELSKGEMSKMPGVDDKMMQKMKDIGLQHCKDDKWPDDVRKCMADAKAMADSQACYGKLTQEQQDKMNKDAMSLQPDAPATGSAGTTGTAPTGESAGSAGSAGSADGSGGSAAPAGSGM